MSRPPPGRTSAASGLAPGPPPPPNGLQPMRGSSIFAPPSTTLVPPGQNVSTGQFSPSRPQSRMEPPPLSATIGPMPGTRENPLSARKKRLIVACDGTWLNADDGIMNGKKQSPSNVSRIGWALKDTSRDGIPQVVHYQAGVGSEGGRITRLLGGAVGFGLKANIREAYNYIATNWNPADDIFLMGFSRGAFTARSVGGIIGDLGLLTKDGLPYFNEIFEDYEHRHNENYVSQFPDAPFDNKPPFSAEYVAELERRRLTRLRIPIKAICCWDTVGSLGIPNVPILGSLRIQPREMNDYQFFDTRLNPYVENAFQALALDERRGPFTPSLWEKKNDEAVNLKQCWFPGVHSNVGGGYDDEELSNLTLAWMMSRLEPFLDFREDYLPKMVEESRHYYKTTEQKARWWSFGELYNSLKGVYSFTGARTRTPGNYSRVDPFTGRPAGKKLRNTNEYMHASVRSRLGLRGPGPLDRGEYDPTALREWSFDVEAGGQGGNMNGQMVVWTNHNADAEGGQKRIPEAILLPTELALLAYSPRVDEYVRTGKEKRRSRRGDGDQAMMVGGIGGPGVGQPGGLEGPPGMMNGGPGGPGSPGTQRRERDRRARSADPAEEGGRRRKRRSRRYDEEK